MLTAPTVSSDLSCGDMIIILTPGKKKKKTCERGDDLRITVYLCLINAKLTEVKDVDKGSPTIFVRGTEFFSGQTPLGGRTLN